MELMTAFALIAIFTAAVQVFRAIVRDGSGQAPPVRSRDPWTAEHLPSIGYRHTLEPGDN
ncbi:hypothetical protein ACX80O_02960 [Arthrobacter sp. Hz1]